MRLGGPAAVTRTSSNWPAAREVILFVAGLAGVIYETLHGPVQPSLLVVFAAMMGLPIILHKDKE
jgi:hypothetical protein